MEIFLLFLSCLIGVAAGPGHSKMCLMCDHVHGPSGCMTHSHCPDACVTTVHHHKHEGYIFSYSCDKPTICHEWTHNHEPHQPHHETPVCRECCHENLCSKYSCYNFINRTTTTTTTPVPTQTATTRKTTIPAATATSTHSVQQTTAAHQYCVDTADPSFSCADMKYFGYCNPSAGAGYALAQQRCPKYCGFCT